VLASGAIGALSGVALIGGLLALLSLPAQAQAASVSGEFERPFGFAPGQETQSFDANTRDANGNRLILDGRIMAGIDQSTLSTASASASSWAQATAGAGFSGNAAQGTSIGNQINVITHGNFNTVIVNATQTNTGNQTTVLNGQLNLND
jgi:holdfast attachment protein HfaA